MDIKIDSDRLPKHIAIIMDGNGRWAKNRGLPRTAGHKMGIESLKKIVDYSGKIGIEILTVYAFSTENWKRPEEEVSTLMALIIEYIRKELDTLHKNNVKINPIGQYQNLPEKTVAEIERARLLTEGNTKLVLNVALNYGSRMEIIQGIKGFCDAVTKGIADLESLDEDIFAQFLYTRDQADPDLIIRPSGEQRLSNFMLWQAAYAELWYSDVLWPDFREKHLAAAIKDYQERDRRYGAVSP